MAESQSVERLYQNLLEAWNDRQAKTMASLYAPSGGQVGFDGSTANSPAEIEALLTPIFKDHPTARYVAKVRDVRMLSEDTAILRAVAGMVPPGKEDLMPDRNAIQTLVASRQPGGEWKVEMFHNTPARFDGRPELAEKLTAELRERLAKQEG
ncbi:MAG: SgcJ/EcaC family oxidoreductase [Pseudomonadota bacterium]